MFVVINLRIEMPNLSSDALGTDLYNEKLNIKQYVSEDID